MTKRDFQAAEYVQEASGGMTEGRTHSPRPWSLMAGMPTNVLDHGGLRVARCDFDGDFDNLEAHANARLIAAAPDLLNVSISSHLWIGSLVNQQNKEGRVISYAIMAALEVAIARGGGKLQGDSFEALAAKDRMAQEEVAAILDEMKKGSPVL